MLQLGAEQTGTRHADRTHSRSDRRTSGRFHILWQSPLQSTSDSLPDTILSSQILTNLHVYMHAPQQSTTRIRILSKYAMLVTNSSS